MKRARAKESINSYLRYLARSEGYNLEEMVDHLYKTYGIEV